MSIEREHELTYQSTFSPEGTESTSGNSLILTRRETSDGQQENLAEVRAELQEAKLEQVGKNPSQLLTTIIPNSLPETNVSQSSNIFRAVKKISRIVVFALGGAVGGVIIGFALTPFAIVGIPFAVPALEAFIGAACGSLIAIERNRKMS